MLSQFHLLFALIHLSAQTRRRVVIEEGIARHGRLHDIGREESGNHTGCHDNRIQSRVGHLQFITQRSDDERELAELDELETGLHGVFHRLTTPPAT